ETVVEEDEGDRRAPQAVERFKAARAASNLFRLQGSDPLCPASGAYITEGIRRYSDDGGLEASELPRTRQLVRPTLGAAGVPPSLPVTDRVKERAQPTDRLSRRAGAGSPSESGATMARHADAGARTATRPRARPRSGPAGRLEESSPAPSA